MKMKKTLGIVLLLALASSMTTAVAAADAPTLTPSFTVEKVETAPVQDGNIGAGEYQLISSYAPTNEDWYTADYGNVYRYAAEGNPDYIVELYGAWDDEALYIGVKVGCPGEHIVDAATVWNGCGVMIGFVPNAPDCGEYDNYQGYDAMGDVLAEIAYNFTADGELNLNNTTNDFVLDESVFLSFARAGGCDIYEMKFEWEPIGCTPSVDKEIGMGTMISFNNPEADDGIDWVCFQTDVVNGKLPQTYTKLILKDDYIPGQSDEPAAEEPAVDAPVEEPVDDAPEAPVTSDAGIVAAAAVMAVAAGVVLSKKRS